MKKKLAILHFMPVEGYPPILNLLQLLEKESSYGVICLTTRGNHRFSAYFRGIKIGRLGCSESTKLSRNKLGLFLSYLLFNLTGFIRLLIMQPQAILYYETISALPGLLYKKCFPSVKLIIHYHEYTTQEEYSHGPQITKHIHRYEKKFYNRVHLISHTNEERLKRFCNDNKLCWDQRFIILPNYPPSHWQDIKNQEQPAAPPFRMVYVGYSLDRDTMFADEIIDFVQSHSNFTLDLYLLKVPAYIEKRVMDTGNRVTLHPAIEYQQLPHILKQYHIGLILYKGKSFNYIYNAPNKLFEYLACDLNVWFPTEMIGCYNYEKRSSRPVIVKVDYNHIDQMDMNELTGSQIVKTEEMVFTCETLYLNWLLLIFP